MPQVTEEDYRSAQENKDWFVRQEFICAIDLDDRKVKTRVYIPSFNPNGVMSISGLGFFENPILKFFEGAFTYEFSTFLNGLLNHEMHHYEQSQTHPIRFNHLTKMRKRGIMRDYIEAIIEIPAYLNQVADIFNPYKIAEGRINGVYNIIYGYEETMKHEAKKFRKDWKRDLSKILCPSPMDDSVRERYGIE